jgi:hypothetical protein
MAADSNAVELAVSRTLRENLERIQRTSDELHQAVSDLVAACASSRPVNSLSPMVRAQMAAASLSATLDVLSRLVTSVSQADNRAASESVPARVTPINVSELPTQTVVLEPKAAATIEENIPTVAEPSATEASSEIPLAPENFVLEEIAPEPPVETVLQPVEFPHSGNGDATWSAEIAATPLPVAVETPPSSNGKVAFDVSILPVEEQELHRRANRVAKVSMQDIKMLRPADVQLGRQNKDLCYRLRDDIEKAHKEYDRRFQPILSHPVDYFYNWMVEILAGGESDALGEYPYPSAVLHR